MTATTKEIFEHFEVRKTRKQKSAFIQWLTPILKENGYTVTVEKGSLGVRNIVIGDVGNAQVVFTAHYDTCAVMPFPNFITPKRVELYILYQLLLTAVMIAVPFAIAAAFAPLVGDFRSRLYLILLYAMLGLMTFGPANKHTANDNTSGVTAVIDLALSMPEELRGKAAFVLFDLEEAGLIGSSAFASKHKKTMKEKLLVNLDCVSDGETMLFVFRKKAKTMVELFRQAFPADSRVESDFAVSGYVYPSDQANFSCGVGVASLKRTKGGVLSADGILYMDRIHTPKDTVYREENITYLVDGCIRLTEMM